jgi:hypothetical protein
MTNTDYYSKEMAKMVGSNDFSKMLGSDANNKIMKYSGFEDKNDINEVIPESRGYRIVLIETKHNTGHWTCLVRYDEKTLVWFDSYGLAPDQEFDFIPVKMQEILDEQAKPLTRLLKNFKSIGGKYNYNTIKFQQQIDGINTCGRWVTSYLYAFLHGFSLKQFQNEMIMEKQQSGLTYDEVVVQCTKPLN